MEEEKPKEKIIPRLIEDEMKDSYIDYSMSVIVGRALPSAKDGLKPVHRRILFAMNDIGMTYNKPFKKSARIVGEVLGKYHPHGDTAVYDSMVRMAQEFSLRYPLIKGQGNFGSIDGDNAAAMRYTEAKLSKIAGTMLEDIKKETVSFSPNFDNTLQEPILLPAKLPNLLVNGSSGIAVGMATNIPPHNLIEVSKAAQHLIKNPESTSQDLMKHISGPDFPTGAYITGRAGIKNAYLTGKGKIKLRAKSHIEETGNRKTIIVTEIPYQVNKSNLLIKIAELVRDKKITGISDLRDESDRDGIRIVIKLKTAANPEIVLNQLYKHTYLQTTFGMNMLALVNNIPQLLTLKAALQHYLDHRFEIVTKRTEFDLKQAKERAHILEGIKIALDNLDKAIKIIKTSKSPKLASDCLENAFKITEIQSRAILEMKLQRLTSLEQNKILDELKEKLRLIEKYQKILSDNQHVFDIIHTELQELIENYGDERKTEILDLQEDIFEDEDLITPKDEVITVTNAGYIKRTSLEEYKEQKRGGKGVIAAATKEEDFIQDLFVANTHSYVLFFTNLGKVYWSKVYRFPESSRSAKGLPIVNLLKLDKEEKITSLIPVREFKQGHYLVMATQNGLVKKTQLKDYSHPRKGGIIAINLRMGDSLVGVKLTNGSNEIILATKDGKAAHFDEKEVRATSRNSIGVKGVKLKKEDQVVGMILAEKGKEILTITKNGYGKRTPISEYSKTHRGASGVINIKCSERNGKVAGILSVTKEDAIMFISKEGITIRTSANGISSIGRNTQGVRLMRLNKGDIVISCAKIIESMEKEPTEKQTNSEQKIPKEESQEESQEEYTNSE